MFEYAVPFPRSDVRRIRLFLGVNTRLETMSVYPQAFHYLIGRGREGRKIRGISWMDAKRDCERLDEAAVLVVLTLENLPGYELRN